MNVVLFGANGNMGSRYRAILNQQKHHIIPLEIGYSHDDIRRALNASKKIIIATPTNSHYDNLLDISIARLPSMPEIDILCEKPVTMKLDELKKIEFMSLQKGMNIYSVNQYSYLPESDKFFNPSQKGPTSYNYFKTGPDGLPWDCYQLYQLARDEEPIVLNKSPKWLCQINGVPINIRNMDQAYIDMISDFLDNKSKCSGLDKIIQVTTRLLNG